MDAAELEAVVQLCAFGYPGVWAAKTTKVAALYRPAAVPVLDGQIASALGFANDDFAVRAKSDSAQSRTDKIRNTITGLRRALQCNANALASIRDHAVAFNPSVAVVTDLRLLDIILWTSQDSRSRLLRGMKDQWIPTFPKSLGSLKDLTPVAVEH